MNTGFISSTPYHLRKASAFTTTAATTPLRHHRPHVHSFRTKTLSRVTATRMTASAAAPPTSWPSAEEASKNSAASTTIMNTEQVMNILPHRYPFLLLDRVIALEPGKRAMGVKSVTVNEPFFPGHFPDRPIMPGVLQVEALAQLGGIVMLQPPFIEDGRKDVDFFFGGVDKVKWRRPVVPGDTLVMEMTLVGFKKSFGIAKMSGKYVLFLIHILFLLILYE